MEERCVYARHQARLESSACPNSSPTMKRILMHMSDLPYVSREATVFLVWEFYGRSQQSAWKFSGLGGVRNAIPFKLRTSSPWPRNNHRPFRSIFRSFHLIACQERIKVSQKKRINMRTIVEINLDVSVRIRTYVLILLRPNFGGRIAPNPNSSPCS